MIGYSTTYNNYNSYSIYGSGYGSLSLGYFEYCGSKATYNDYYTP